MSNQAIEDKSLFYKIKEEVFKIESTQEKIFKRLNKKAKLKLMRYDFDICFRTLFMKHLVRKDMNFKEIIERLNISDVYVDLVRKVQRELIKLYEIDLN